MWFVESRTGVGLAGQSRCFSSGSLLDLLCGGLFA